MRSSSGSNCPEIGCRGPALGSSAGSRSASARARRLAAAGLGLLVAGLMTRAEGFRLLIAPGEGTGPTVILRIPEAGSNDVYQIEYSSDLTNWSWCASRVAASNGFSAGFFVWDEAQFYRARRLQ